MQWSPTTQAEPGAGATSGHIGGAAPVVPQLVVVGSAPDELSPVEAGSPDVVGANPVDAAAAEVVAVELDIPELDSAVLVVPAAVSPDVGLKQAARRSTATSGRSMGRACASSAPASTDEHRLARPRRWSMTRHTDPIRRTGGVIRLEAAGERDESDPYRHKWVTRLRFGLLSAEGPNTSGAVDRLADELRELASCPEAITALATARHTAMLRRQREEHEAKQAAEVERRTSGCQHFAVEDGPRTPLRHGSAATKVCRSCGAWHIADPAWSRLDGQLAWRLDEIAPKDDEDE